MNGKRTLTTFGIAVMALALLAGLTAAQGPEPESQAAPQGELAITGTVDNDISYQGVLMEDGRRVTGLRNMTFRLYSNSSCTGAQVDSFTKTNVNVTNGLFDVDLDFDHALFNGQGLWLRVVVGGTSLGCEEILPVPYALSLRPGADMRGEVAGASMLWLQNDATSGQSNGIRAKTSSPNGYGGAFANDSNGIAIKAEGSGRIASTADSYVFVPGGQAVIHGATSGATLKYWGGGDVQLSADTPGSKEIVFPVTMPAILYGQPVRVEEIAFTFRHTEFAEISRVWVYRMRMDGSYRTILDDSTGWSSVSPFWTTLTFPLSADNVLSAEDGQLAVRVTCNLEPANNVQFVGVRIRLGHD
jgi:hypothetical protein